MTGAWPDLAIEHIGDDKTDIRWANLHEITPFTKDQQHLHRIYGVQKSRAKIRNIAFEITFEEWVASDLGSDKSSPHQLS